MHAELYAFDHLLDIGPVHHLVGELAQPRLAFDQKDRHAEFHAELGLKLVGRAVMDQGVRHVVIGADFHPLHPVAGDAVLADQAQHLGHARMGQRSRRMRLDGNARRQEGPGFAELSLDPLDIVPAAMRLEEAARSLEYLFGRRPAQGREVGGRYTAFRRPSGMEGLGHAAEVLSQAGRLATRQRQRPARGLNIQPVQLGNGSGGSEGTAGGRRMETVLVVPG